MTAETTTAVSLDAVDAALAAADGNPGEDEQRLAFIRQAQAAGLTLEHIRQVVDIRDGGQPPCVHVTGLISRRLTEVEARLAELARARDQLAALAARAAAQDPADCRGYCSIIAAGAPPAALDLPATGKA